MRGKGWLSIVLVLAAIGPARGASGDPDAAFGVAGLTSAVVGSNRDVVAIAGLVALGTGSLAVVGHAQAPTDADNYLAAWHPDGRIDAQFGAAGIVIDTITLATATAVVPQPGGGLLVVGILRNPSGAPSLYLARYTASGALDPAFGQDGVRLPSAVDTNAVVPAHGAAMQPDGRIVIVLSIPGATSQSQVVRVDADGSLDATFGNGGFAPLPPVLRSALAIAVQPDGGLVVAGAVDGVDSFGRRTQFFALARLLARGGPDASFAEAGVQTTSVPATQPLLGITAVDPVASLATLADGRVLLAVSPGPSFRPYNPAFQSPDVMVMRFLASGALDGSFGASGVATTTLDVSSLQIRALTVHPDGRLTVAGYALDTPGVEALFVRWREDGALDASFASGGVSKVVLPVIGVTGLQALMLKADGKLLAAVADVGQQGTVGLLQVEGDATLAVIEYYHAALDHYFVTEDPAEVSDLDHGVHPGWTRTGQRFNAYAAAASGAAPACRYYIPPVHGDSHFISALPAECADVASRVATDPNYSGYVLETPAAFYEALPAGDGSCPAGTLPVYRLWNGRVDSNHRYTTSRSIRDAMIAKGYVSEGLGADGVGFCAPQ